MSPYKRNTRRYLALKLRDVYGISAVDIVVVKSLTDCLLNTTKLKKFLSKTGRLTEERSSTIKKLQLMIVHQKITALDRASAASPPALHDLHLIEI